MLELKPRLEAHEEHHTGPNQNQLMNDNYNARPTTTRIPDLI